MTSEHEILALKRRDCARFLKIQYFFGKTITEQDLKLLGDFNIQINKFSQFLPNAKDHYYLNSPTSIISISGIIGEKNFDVTYGKFTKENSSIDSYKADFEKLLISLGFGTKFLYHDHPSLVA